MIRAPSRRAPSGPTKRRSNGSARGPARSDSIAVVVWRLASRYAGDLDDLGVHPEGHVVDEDPPVHRAQVDAPLDGGVEGVQRGEDVVAVQPEVEGEAVASAGGDAHQRHVGRHRHARDQRLRSVPAGHADHVRPALDGTPGELEQVVTGLEDHRLDAASAALLRQREPLGLPAAGPWVHDEDAVRGRVHLAAGGRLRSQRLAIAPQRVADEDRGPGEQREHDDEAQRRGPPRSARRG